MQVGEPVTLFQRYRVVSLLGRGAFADVWLAQDLRIGREVALKTLRDGSAETRQALLAEAALLSSFDHPGLPRVFDVHLGSDGRAAYTLEALAGEDLAGLGPLDGAGLTRVATQALGALAALHDRGLLHGDVSRRNLRLDRPWAEGGRVKLLDLGLASPRGHRGRRGTPAYLSPESLAGEATDERSDLYSLGVVLFELATGRGLGQGLETGELLRRKVDGAFRLEEEGAAGIGGGLGRLIARLMEVDPRQRPGDAREALSSLADGAPPDLPALAGVETWGDALQRMDAAAEEVLRRGHARLLVVEGPRGHHRARLGDTFRLQLEARGWGALGPALGAVLPFTCASALLPAPPGPEGGEGAARARRILGGEVDPAGGTWVDRAEDVATYIGQTRGEGPWVALIDVDGGADPASVEVLRRLGPRLEERALLVVLLTEAADGPAVAPLKDEWRTSLVALAPLGEGALAALLLARLGEFAGADALVAGVYRSTGGELDRVEATLGHLARAGVLARAEGRWVLDEGRLAAALSEVRSAPGARLAAQLSGLPAAARRVLGALAVGGEVEAVGPISGLGPEAVAGGLEALARAGILCLDGLGFRAAEPWLWDQVEEGLDGDTRAGLARRAASWCLARAAAEGGRIDRVEAAVGHLVRAGDASAVGVAVELAPRLIALKGPAAGVALLRAVLPLGEADAAQALQLREQLAEAHRQLGDHTAAAEALEPVITRTQAVSPASPPERRAEAARLLQAWGTALSRSARWDDALRALSRARALLGGDASVSQRLSLAHDQALIRHYQGDLRGAERHLLSTLRQAGALSAPRGAAPPEVHLPADASARHVLSLLHALAAVLWQQGRHAEAEALLRRVLLAEGVGEEDLACGLVPAGEGQAEATANLAVVLGNVLLDQGRGPEAERLLRGVVAWYEATGRHQAAARCLNNLAVARMQRGDWQEATLLWERFRQVCDRVRDAGDLAIVLNNLGGAYVQLGRMGPARRRLEQARALAEEAGYARLLGMIQGNLGELGLKEGRPAEARALFEAALDTAREVGARDDEVEGLRRLAELEAEEDARAAQGRATAALALARETGNAIEEGTLLGLLGLLQVRAGAAAPGLALLDRGEQQLSELGAEIEWARLRMRRAAALAHLERWEEADPILAEVEAVFERLGARWDLGRVQALSEALDQHAPGVSSSRKNLQILLDVGASLASVLDLEKLLDLIIIKALELTGAQRGFVILLDGEGRPRVRAARHMDQKEVDGEASAVSSTLVRRVLERREAVAVTDVDEDRGLRDQESVVALGLRSIMAAPLLRQGRVLGIVYVDSPNVSRTVHQRDQRMLAALAETAAVAVENAQLYEDLKRKTEMMYFMAHEFRSPLTAVISFADLVLSDGANLRDDQRDFLRIILEQGQRLGRMVSGVLDLAKLKSERAVWLMEPVDLADVAARTVQGLAPIARDRGVGVEVVAAADLPRILGNPDRLVQVFTNLLANAYRFARRQVTVRVGRVALSPTLRVGVAEGEDSREGWIRRSLVPGYTLSEEQGVEVRVEDDGPGVPEAALTTIFDTFSQEGPPAARKEGTGLGLAIAREIVDRHGGRVWAERRAEGGAAFVVVFPVPVPERSPRGR